MKDNLSKALHLTFDNFALAITLFGAYNSLLGLLTQASGFKLDSLGNTLIIQTTKEYNP